jgi:predicted ATP-binding protein involved in virulence
MKLLSFDAENVYGYFKFNIKFNDKLSFLVGGNGSGKTTILKLIQAVLTPNLKDIYLIPFTKIELLIHINSKDQKIKVDKSEDGINISINDEIEPLRLPYKDIDELSYILTKEENLFNRELFHHRNNDTFKFIQNLDVPLFLGLERLENTSYDEDRYERHDQIIIRDGQRRIIRKNRYIDGSLSISLKETQSIVQSVYEKIRRKEDFHRKQLRNKILLSSFHYADIDDLLDENNQIKKISLLEQKNIMSKKEDIANALKNLGFDKNKDFKEMEQFFEKVEKLFSDMAQSPEDGVGIAWLINKSQIDRIQKLINLIEENNEKVKKNFELIDKFIDTMNYFLQDTGKSIEIDSIGTLKIKKPNGDKANIEALSSGERQLIVMFSHLIFKNESNPSGVFIIDEPELSLHIDWQKDFIKYAIEANPNTQLILATHSPDIFIGNEKKTILVKRA